MCRLVEWFGEFYDMLQKALSAAVVSIKFYGQLYTFFQIAAIYIVVNVVFNGFFVNHYCFRWRRAMADYYQENWQKAEQLKVLLNVFRGYTKVCKIDRELGVGLLESVLMLVNMRFFMDFQRV